ncbi:MAG: succinylglutamate desuccinylase/aspartoacylase family protein [Planctomycetes bacterium]|nr:succinylglutamate desuccinylase/aspartoacylase family protein [Planctomycetota bacterium]
MADPVPAPVPAPHHLPARAPASGMRYAAYAQAFARTARRWNGKYLLSVVGKARSVPRAAPLLRLAPARVRHGGLMILAGFHGEEPAGPLCLLRYVHHIVGRAGDLKVPLCIYPVANPFGFDQNRRCTVEGKFTNAGFVHDEDVTGPEVALLRADMLRYRPEVFLDLHEDDHESRAYLYSFGEPQLAARLVATQRAFLEVAEGALSHTPAQVATAGQVRDHHDGSAEDFMSHAGTRASFAIETPTCEDLRVRMAVHLAIIDACLDDIAARRGGGK